MTGFLWQNGMLYARQKEQGKHFLFVLAPSQLYQPEELLPVGFTHPGNESSDQLIRLLEQKGIPYLDLRRSLVENGIKSDDAFFVTDSHWKPETGFWAYGRILEKIAETGAIGPVDTAYTDPENFEFTVYEKAFLGAYGERTGIYYGGIDDITKITPKFETEISVRIDTLDVDVTGSFGEVAYKPHAETVFRKRDYFNQNPYANYGWGNRDLVNWRNEAAPERQKVLMIGDSFGNVPFTFLPLYFSSCDELDMREFSGDFQAHYNEYAPDHVIVLVNQFGISSDNVLYDFFPEDAA